MAGLPHCDRNLYAGGQAEHGGGRWYYSRKEIEENSPSRRDGIDSKKEKYLRKTYSMFMKDLGMKLNMAQVTIATAIIMAHRFFLRQSHAKNDWRVIATACIFLAGKVKETPLAIRDVIIVSYRMIYKEDPAAVQRIKQKEFNEQQKELILLGEHVVLATLGFDFDVAHPYKILSDALLKFKVDERDLAQRVESQRYLKMFSWNFVNDGLTTSLCLQFKPQQIAATAIFLAARYLKVKLLSDGEKFWWQELNVTARQLEEISNQMLEIYESRPPQTSKVEGSGGGGVAPRATTKAQAAAEGHTSNYSTPESGVSMTMAGTSKSVPSHPGPHLDPRHSYLDNHSAPRRVSHNRSDDHASSDMTSITYLWRDGDNHCYDPESSTHMEEILSNAKHGLEGLGEEDLERNVRKSSGEFKDKFIGRNLNYEEKIDKDKIKAAMEKRKACGATARTVDFTDEDDLIERELEDGVELAKKIKLEKRQSWSKPSTCPSLDGLKHQSLSGQDFNNVEEGELVTFDNADRGYHEPKSWEKDWKPA